MLLDGRQTLQAHLRGHMALQVGVERQLSKSRGAERCEGVGRLTFEVQSGGKGDRLGRVLLSEEPLLLLARGCAGAAVLGIAILLDGHGNLCRLLCWSCPLVGSHAWNRHCRRRRLIFDGNFALLFRCRDWIRSGILRLLGGAHRRSAVRARIHCCGGRRRGSNQLWRSWACCGLWWRRHNIELERHGQSICLRDDALNVRC